MTTVDEAPGWSAIEAALDGVTGDVAPLHWGTNNLPDQDGIYGMNAYALDGYWLLLTLGLSELFSKVSDDPYVSGWGIELTMRVPRADGIEAPPQWALNLLNKLGEYVYQSGRVVEAGHRMNPGGPITGSPGTQLTGLVSQQTRRFPRCPLHSGASPSLQSSGSPPRNWLLRSRTRMRAASSLRSLSTIRC